MGIEKYKYFLTWKDSEVSLFESQFQFLAQDVCLAHYEKGLARGLFSFDRSRINQVWSELGLWGLIGRLRPVELVRILCAFGCEIKIVRNCKRQLIQKSFRPVTYILPFARSEQKHVLRQNRIRLEPGTNRYIPIFLVLDKRLVIGNYYLTSDTDVDSQFPKFCSQLESDSCLPRNSIRICVFNLFWHGFNIQAQDQSKYSVIVQRDVQKNILRGLHCEETLKYLSAA